MKTSIYFRARKPYTKGNLEHYLPLYAKDFILMHRLSGVIGPDEDVDEIIFDSSIAKYSLRLFTKQGTSLTWKAYTTLDALIHYLEGVHDAINIYREFSRRKAGQ